MAAVATWDLWEWGRTKYARDASASQEKQAMNTLAGVKDQVTLEVKNAWLAVKEAEKLIAVTEMSIEQAEENYRINQERYREQVSRMTDVLDALTLLTVARAYDGPDVGPGYLRLTVTADKLVGELVGARDDSGSPPRARGRHAVAGGGHAHHGLTPACAGTSSSRAR